MISITVHSRPPQNDVTFPCLMVFNHDRFEDLPPSKQFIVLFANEDAGTVIFAGTEAEHAVGYHSADWSIYAFTKFHGTLTLENDQ